MAAASSAADLEAMLFDGLRSFVCILSCARRKVLVRRYLKVLGRGSQWLGLGRWVCKLLFSINNSAPATLYATTRGQSLRFRCPAPSLLALPYGVVT